MTMDYLLLLLGRRGGGGGGEAVGGSSATGGKEPGWRPGSDRQEEGSGSNHSIQRFN